MAGTRDKVLESYRDQLTQAKIRTQEARDSAVLTLSGGALGVSFAFIDHFVKGQPHLPLLLFFAWGCWAASLVLHIVNYRFSEKAFDWQIERTDSQLEGTELDNSVVNSSDNRVTMINITVMALFVVGVISLGIFVFANYGSQESCERQDACCASVPVNSTIHKYERR